MLTCRELVQTLASDYLDNRLNWRRRLGVRFHLLICKQCHRFMHQFGLLRSVLARRPEPPPAEPDVKALAERLYNEYQRGNGPPRE